MVKELKFSKKPSVAAYRYLCRHGDGIIFELKLISNRKIRLKDAANHLGLDIVSFLILLGHLKKVGLVKEVRIV